MKNKRLGEMCPIRNEPIFSLLKQNENGRNHSLEPAQPAIGDNSANQWEEVNQTAEYVEPNGCLIAIISKFPC